MSRLLRAAGCCLALVLASAALADEGRIPIWQPVNLGAGDTGTYVVTRNVANLGGPVINIVGTGVENIDIDINGMTLTGGAHVVSVSNVATFVLRNGTLEAETAAALGDGVNVTNHAGEVVLEDLTIQRGVGNGIFIGDGVETFAIRRNMILNPFGDGILINGGET